MRWKRLATAIVALAFSSQVMAALQSEPATRVRTKSGALAGAREGDILIFRGIPYAAPPIGPLRWRAPQPAKPWQGVRDATHYGAACPQAPIHKEAWAQVGPQSEDCLFLNIWRTRQAGAYPVMLFLHGGGFTYGSAGVPLYDGANLASRGAVIVTLNYRLGRLGFFAHPALTREDPNGRLGNYGVMDQLAALDWVRANIGRFGGDPLNIMLFGEPAGAGVVQLLMASPVSRGLFQKAISESGAGGASLIPIRGGTVNAEAVGETWSKSLGLNDPTAEQLRAIPLAEVIKGRSFPFIDGKVVVRSPGDPFHRGEEMPIPLMIGSNSGEASLPSNTAAAAEALLGDAYPAVLKAYAARAGATEHSAAIDLAEDANSVLPSLSLADMHAANGAKAYGFYFTQVPVDERATSAGAIHGGEIEYLFGNQPAEHRWDATDRAVSKLMGDYWVRFAKTGNPNGGGAPNWPAVSGQPTVYQVIGADTHAATLSPLEERVQQLVLDNAVKRWTAADAK